MENFDFNVGYNENEYSGGYEFKANDGKEYLVYGGVNRDTNEKVVLVYERVGVKPNDWVKENEFTPNKERDAWFDNLLIRELVGTEEFFYVWQDYKCTTPQGFSDVVTDIWYHGVSEEFKDEFYAKYKDVFTSKKQAE